MKKRNIFLMLFFMSVCLLIGGVQADAKAQYSIDAVIPENQLDKSQTYFDLLMKSGAQQDLIVKIENIGDKEVTLLAGLNSATTNDHGFIEYRVNDIKPDESLKYNLKDFATADEKITVPAQSTVEYKIHIKMPKEPIDGEIVGGVTFKEDATTLKEEDKDISVASEYAYGLAIVLHFNTDEVAPDLKLKDVNASQNNRRNVILVNLQNPAAVFLYSLRVEADIYKKNSDKVVYELKKSGLMMAPNTNFNFTIPCEVTPLEGGDYIAKVTAYGEKDEGGKYEALDEYGEKIKYKYRWTFEKDFHIDKAKAKKYNQEDINLIQSGYKEKSNLPYIIAGVILLIIIAILLFIILKKKKKEKDYESR